MSKEKPMTLEEKIKLNEKDIENLKIANERIKQQIVLRDENTI